MNQLHEICGIGISSPLALSFVAGGGGKVMYPIPLLINSILLIIFHFLFILFF
ncbi:hypothetical protein Lalb_Chr16g0389151 [Lupinus albus]|uniref:Uncharacterized protein n=1 Tax=Lupinus albus TaxID=3870 RepID=A0A6A4PC07_LUPAL|nr:hypothetical protein Lalb_Chr16g0389151 [Lupinus albus]